MHRTAWALIGALTVGGLSVLAQAPAQAPVAASAAPPQQVFADMNQLMRGVLYPAANVVFASQLENAGEVKLTPGHDPSMSTDPLTSTYGGWTAIENGALALAESGNLLLIPRSCANGVPAPTQDPAWVGFVQDMRAVSMKAYAAAKAKEDQEKMIALSETLAKTCSSCHRRWRDRRGAEARCK